MRRYVTSLSGGILRRGREKKKTVKRENYEEGVAAWKTEFVKLREGSCSYTRQALRIKQYVREEV